MIEFGKSLGIQETSIPGLLILDLPVHGDSRGWFKENWQREKMLAAGLPDLGPVQNNISFNDEVGTTRGIHAEPWDKYVSVATGKIFGAWVDLREGVSFGKVFTAELDASKAIFVPRGVANSYQTLEADTAYVYLVNDHWSPTAEYTFLNLADETAAIKWPIPLENALLSEKDQAHPRLKDVVPMKAKKTLVLGANGQLGLALRKVMPEADFVTRSEFDVTDEAVYNNFPWKQYSTVINASAYTSVDNAETHEGRFDAWMTNVTALGRLARACSVHRLTLVHISSDYVFDGTSSIPYPEDASFSPLGVYGQTKAAADVIVATVPQHYIVRTSWVIGEGNNFVRTMASLAERGIKPSVVNDQIGRLTFTQDLAAGIQHLLCTKPAFGTYNLSNEGNATSWADIASEVFELLGHSPTDITGVTTEDYFAGKEGIAPRPLNSMLDLSKITRTGFSPASWQERLQQYFSN
ncbi:dTDP-4-dehydrorhamnose reductase/dTDP-4-dehydrorhamnose 3,5-epimerase [Aurantimicrobium minutum]|uniref:bifunctional dTDP-4-dehydrorhamnose 3,5-epimerase family protein/NAD(P)-dependent oxidoreductase n=1 Tax=Aurantimicrobium minutum TaxID=708131 RepID=UPI002476CC7D|nr:bifunctional dTDP-4-dehydrorhamnose 3,5-epimerase family protein/NAD(P)-dependent oxidoreductase [Aurantimicrobium minutum]MDH6410542.1 dTDP-4-dehydrorhamnose reductase/dTDP-4-dehydrorhamnose 3,5-epimerase [Aurantimicrobium minutum]